VPLSTPATIPPATRPQVPASGAGQAAGRQRLAWPAAGEEQRLRSGRGLGGTAAAWLDRPRAGSNEEPGRGVGHARGLTAAARPAASKEPRRSRAGQAMGEDDCRRAARREQGAEARGRPWARTTTAARPAASKEPRHRAGHGRGATAAVRSYASKEPRRTAGRGQAAANRPWVGEEWRS